MHVEVGLPADPFDRPLHPDREAAFLGESSHPVTFFVDGEVPQQELWHYMMVMRLAHFLASNVSPFLAANWNRPIP